MNKIDIQKNHLKILQGYAGVYVFGSRAVGRSKKFSDIDLCVIQKKRIPISEIAKIKGRCEDSNLPFTVDVVDYNSASSEFQKIIDRDKVPFPYN